MSLILLVCVSRQSSCRQSSTYIENVELHRVVRNSQSVRAVLQHAAERGEGQRAASNSQEGNEGGGVGS